jgi:hypothetical protein
LVETEVDGEVGVGAEGLAAVGTLVGAYLVVNAVVESEGVLGGEAGVALGTAEGLGVKVREEVAIGGSARGVDLVAGCAMEFLVLTQLDLGLFVRRRLVLEGERIGLGCGGGRLRVRLRLDLRLHVKRGRVRVGAPPLATWHWVRLLGESQNISKLVITTCL